jgi:hypothetical protein
MSCIKLLKTDISTFHIKQKKINYYQLFEMSSYIAKISYNIILVIGNKQSVHAADEYTAVMGISGVHFKPTNSLFQPHYAKERNSISLSHRVFFIALNDKHQHNALRTQQ